MIYNERRSRILEFLDINESVTYKELSNYLGVSEATIRRDLSAMEKQSDLIRFWGGARRNPDRPIKHSTISQGMISEDKRIIGEIAASYVMPNELIFIGSGTTTLAMIDYIKIANITVITNGIAQIEALKRKNIQAFLLCGFLKEYSRAVAGRQTVEMLSSYHFDKAFFGANGFDSNLSLLSADEYEHDIKQVGIRNSTESFVLVDHKKFDCFAMYRIPRQELGKISIITDQRIDKNIEYEKSMRGYIYNIGQ